MRILLTGSAGFLGSALGPRLVAAGHELYCICRPGTSVAYGQNIPWDGEEPIGPSRLPRSVDVIIHLAQSRRYRRFPEDAHEMFAVNVAMTMSLLEWAAQSQLKQFCLVSSGAVYEPFGGILREDTALAPAGFLGASKLASEIIAKPFSRIFGLNTLRLFFPYGPGQRDRLIPELIRRVRDCVPVRLPSNGVGIRLTPTFVEDIVDVILGSINAGWTGTMNVATPETLSIRQIANMMGQQLGMEPIFEIANTDSAVDVIPDLNRLVGRFELSRFTQFEEGLKRTMAEGTGELVETT
jgi:nucleoside-diphosphate-sugar epimerase